jgi:hypothetical protein
MAGPTTQSVADEVKELGLRVAESNERLTEAIHDLGHKFDDFRVQVADKLGAINTNLETFKGRMETALAVAKWTVTAVVPILLTLIYWSYSATGRAVHIEDSIAALRDHAKEQDDRIAKLIDLRGVNEPPRTTPNPKPADRND